MGTYGSKRLSTLYVHQFHSSINFSTKSPKKNSKQELYVRWSGIATGSDGMTSWVKSNFHSSGIACLTTPLRSGINCRTECVETFLFINSIVKIALALNAYNSSGCAHFERTYIEGRGHYTGPIQATAEVHCSFKQVI